MCLILVDVVKYGSFLKKKFHLPQTLEACNWKHMYFLDLTKLTIKKL